MLPPASPASRRHPFPAVLLVAASAVVAGARSFAAIGQWAAHAPQQTRARLGARLVASLNVRLAPSTATIRRVINAVCPGGLADLTGTVPNPEVITGYVELWSGGVVVIPGLCGCGEVRLWDGAFMVLGWR
ncbi:transposase family protein [Streptomyces halobius]|uniref:Transposase family protein n=1 Tax=Streptomyces halobius TaxID=2879846 RepID=A0ABY4ML52_9ACTN|nr:transposase family protein [Streptomyces halobius]UQA98077.1 transposase family protein [Streptomyces halobius]